MNIIHRTCFRLLANCCLFALLISPVCSQEPQNPYQKAAVGDWLKYEVKVENSFAPFEYTSVSHVTAIEGDMVRITQDVITSDGDEYQYHSSINRAKPLSLFDLLGYDKPHELPMKKVDQGRETLLSAGRELKTEWFQYDIGRGTAFPAEKHVWICGDVPLDGVVKRLTISKGFSSNVSTSVLVAFGGADDPIPSGKSKTIEESIEKLLRVTNSIEMTLVRIKQGKFAMGAIPQADFLTLTLDTRTDEEKLELVAMTPPHRQTVIKRDYWMATHEVTVKQFREFVNATGYQSDAERDGKGGTGLMPSGQFGQSPGFTWKNVGFPLNDTHPAVNVSWNDAQAFCKWLSKKENATYRLPTEAEWEFACRAGTSSRFFCGEDTNDLAEYANVADQALAAVTPGLPWPTSFNDKVEYLAEVGSYRPNRFGLYDMHGNALEWCQTRFSFLDPLEHLDLPVADDEVYCLRGGNWFNDANRAGSACRTGAPPETRMCLIGFRVVKEYSDSDKN